MNDSYLTIAKPVVAARLHRKARCGGEARGQEVGVLDPAGAGCR